MIQQVKIGKEMVALSEAAKRVDSLEADLDGLQEELSEVEQKVIELEGEIGYTKKLLKEAKEQLDPHDLTPSLPCGLQRRGYKLSQMRYAEPREQKNFWGEGGPALFRVALLFDQAGRVVARWKLTRIERRPR